jgi:maltose/moltooligosaccharide transporter
MGVFMGLFNMSITIPQIVNGIFGGLMLQYLFNDNPINSIYFAGVCMIIAAGTTFLVKDKLEKKLPLTESLPIA